MKRLIKKTEEINLIREGGHILDQILKDVSALVRPGIQTLDLEERALELIEKAGGRPAFKGYKPDKSYRPFPFL
jgi:methionyl aminopeptidase